MSEHVSPNATADLSRTLETEFDAFQSSPALDGPVERLDDHACNDHFAHIYETDDERFAAAVPFVRQGLERGERVMFIVDETDEAEVRAAVRDAGLDVDNALDSGALSFHTVQETYLRDGAFSPNEMLEFYADTVAAATEEFEALRIVAGTTWLRDDTATVEQFMEYESKVNDLFADEACLALCQYDRGKFGPETVRNVIRTHPHLVYDGEVCHNFYYTPPEEFFGPDAPVSENERMLRTLRDRTVAEATLRRRERDQREFYEITSDSTRSFEEKIRRLLEFGTERFDLEIGYFTRTDGDDTFTIVDAVGPSEQIRPGVTDSICDTYCEKLLASPGSIAVRDAANVGWKDDPAYERFGLDAYFGTTVHAGGEEYGTLCFASETPREEQYTRGERAFLDLIGQWMGNELERQQREAFLRESYEITSDGSRSFEAKLDALCDLGCEQFGLDLGGLAKIDPGTDFFEIELVSGDHDHLVPGARANLSDTYCRVVAEDGAATADAEPVAVTDPVADGFEGELCYEEFGVRTYFGTYLEIDGDVDRTFWFVSNEPRDEPFTDTERTFLDLISQWVKYELERRQREAFLRESYEITSDPNLSFEEKLERLFELGRERFGLEMAGLNHLPSWDGEFRLEKGVGLGVADDEELWSDPGYGCFCRQTIESEDPVSMADVAGTDWVEDPIHQEFGLTSYLGTKVSSGTSPYGTLWFGSTEARDREFSETERTFVELMGQWVSYELEQREHEQSQRELYEITADNELSTDEKFQRLLELGCEHLDLPVGMVTREREEAFEIKQMHGSHPDLGEGSLTPPLTDNYCRKVVDTGSPVSVADAEAAGWEGDALYHEFGLACYAGVQLTVGDDAYGTICFTDLSPRDAAFTDAEQTFLELMGQCMSYELERTHREEELERKNGRLENFASMLAHELRNPTMIGQIYSQQLPDESDSEAVEYVTEAFDRIEDMVDVMLVLTRGREAVGERAPVDLSAVAERAWADVDAPDAELDSEIGDVIEADETYVEHLFRNLLENAVEHGGADVTVTVGHLPDDSASEASGASTDESVGGFYVADDGEGIPAEDRDAVFEEGFTTSADSGGSGIGLAFVRKLAAVYGWEYAVTESEAGGARFEFTGVQSASQE
ncbi:MEDS domain-containing protein [Halorussus limi]|uniref:histidine kinase n=1 Tax=Halorussus limi TaxID=2938695 RepID=A0A8U0HPB8_9EURY|nr:MEDS domain-containing protein [Halorussus limi]UPV72885.1 MEDS domain-containing protein [Halorussus limi]